MNQDDFTHEIQNKARQSAVLLSTSTPYEMKFEMVTSLGSMKKSLDVAHL